ncbi:hypothetical protein OY671_010646, partial [Metschnikowia pulcherrima]
ELSEAKAEAAAMRERCATSASALEITTRISDASADPQSKAGAAAARSSLDTAGRCGAHTKRNQLTKQDDVVWSSLSPKHVDAEIRVYVRGWNAAMDDARRVVAAASPSEGSD